MPILIALLTAFSFYPQRPLEPVEARVFVNNELRVSLVPPGEFYDYANGGPSVSVPIGVPGAHTATGRGISGLDVIGWREGERYRIVVFALVPKAGEPAAQYDMGFSGDKLRREELTHILMKAGDEVRLDTPANKLPHVLLKLVPRTQNLK